MQCITRVDVKVSIVHKLLLILLIKGGVGGFAFEQKIA
jgi:hypothetical protein